MRNICLFFAYFLLLFIIGNAESAADDYQSLFSGLKLQPQPQSQPQQLQSVNLTLLIGDTVQLNCSLKFNSKQNARDGNNNNIGVLSPTWLKAEMIYDQSGESTGLKTESIIVTRKGIIVDSLRDKLRLSTIEDRVQSLTISNVNVKDEGKYICRRFNSENDKLFFIKVYSSVSGLTMKFSSTSKYFQVSSSNNMGNKNMRNSINSNNHDKNHADDTPTFSTSLSNSVYIRENDELIVNCTVNSSKPAADLSLWISPNLNNIPEDDMRKLDIMDFYTVRNKDYTLKSIAVAKYKVSRDDHQKSIICFAENVPLEEKWETKRALNVLYPPKCNKDQKLTYHTGINQTIELECRMTDANPSHLDFSWSFMNSRGIKEKTRSNGFTSKINWTPKSENDFGEITCTATNNLDSGQCKINVELGGPPNPPENCYYKENNATVIIECVPGFHQGDPDVYYYLLKKKSNGVVVEYARKRDSCSFLISTAILEEHMNEFFIYSSNKYGGNKETSVKLIIENKEILLRNMNKNGDGFTKDSKTLTIVIAGICTGLFILIVCCCVCVRLSTKQANKALNSQSMYDDYRSKSRSHETFENRKMLSVSNFNDSQLSDNEKLYSTINRSEKGSKKFGVASTFLMKDIEVLDMSPKSKRNIITNENPDSKHHSNDEDDSSYFDNLQNKKVVNEYEDSSPDTEYKSYYMYADIKTKNSDNNVWYANGDIDKEDEYQEANVDCNEQQRTLPKPVTTTLRRQQQQKINDDIIVTVHSQQFLRNGSPKKPVNNNSNTFGIVV